MEVDFIECVNFFISRIADGKKIRTFIIKSYFIMSKKSFVLISPYGRNSNKRLLEISFHLYFISDLKKHFTY